MSNDIVKISNLFAKTDICFQIPDYQRAYSWEESELQTFFNDIEEVSKTGNHQYYLGHYLFEVNNSNETEWYIIDGQQRLTTVVIFMSVIKDYIGGNKNNDIEKEKRVISSWYLEELATQKQRLKTVSYDNNFFYQLIKDEIKGQSVPQTKSQKNLLFAKEFFIKKLSNLGSEKCNLFKKIIENSEITFFLVNNPVFAAEIFSYQNDRGKLLTNLEKIKSWLMLTIYLKNEKNKPEVIDRIQQEIAIIYRVITEISLKEDDILLYFWRAFGPQGYNSRELLDEIKKEYVNKSSTDLYQFILDLKNAFIAVKEIEHDDNSYVKDLFVMDYMADVWPILIKAKMKITEQSIFYKVVKLCENLAVRFMIINSRASKNRFNSLLEKANDSSSFNNFVDEVMFKINRDINWGYWSDENFLERLNSGYFYNQHTPLHRNYLLWKYELAIRDENYPYDSDFKKYIKDVNADHIAPQTENEKIESGYGPYNNDADPQKGIESGHWLHCLGNLVLISGPENKAFGNKAFNIKLSYYKKDPLAQLKEISSFVSHSDPEWNVSAIQKRHKKIIDTLKSIYCFSSSLVDTEDW